MCIRDRCVCVCTHVCTWYVGKCTHTVHVCTCIHIHVAANMHYYNLHAFKQVYNIQTRGIATLWGFKKVCNHITLRAADGSEIDGILRLAMSCDAEASQHCKVTQCFTMLIRSILMRSTLVRSTLIGSTLMRSTLMRSCATLWLHQSRGIHAHVPGSLSFFSMLWW